jgi:tetratricopeptide (TPR) repeat protein
VSHLNQTIGRSPIQFPRALTVVVLLSGAVVQAQSALDVRALLDRYGAGEHRAVSAVFAGIRDLRTFHAELERITPAWIVSADPADAPRRRLLVASFALEAAYGGPRRWADARNLVEWGCEMVRDGRSEAHRFWHLAAIALIESAHDYLFLADGGPRFGPIDRNTIRGRARNHLEHALSSFPNEPRLFLAYALTHEYASWGSDAARPLWAEQINLRAELAPDLRFGSDAVRQYFDRPYFGHTIHVAAAKSDTLWKLADIFQGRGIVPGPHVRLAAAPSIRPEVNVRLGHTYIRLARPDLAEPLFRQALADTEDPHLRYLAHLFSARGGEGQGRSAAAEQAYRQALNHAPNAQSAALPLAAALFITGRRAEAERLVASSVASEPLPDPWRLYQSGDARYFRTYLERLRGELR